MRKAHLTLLGFLLLATGVWAGALPAQARGAERPVQGPPDPKHRVLSGSEWLGGAGVDVFYLNKVECVKDRCPLEYGSVHLSCPFQCVDLAVRLYDKVGYTNFIKSSSSSSSSGTRISAAEELANTSDLQKPPNERLSFYKNRSADRPPAPGDLLVFEASAQNGYFGHVAVVDWVAGDTLEYVQQNVCPTGSPEPRGRANVEVKLDNGKQLFSVKDITFAGVITGWVHSDLIKQRLIDQPEMRQAGDIRWNRDDTAVYVYLSPERTRAAAQGMQIDKEIANLLKDAGALSFTNYKLAEETADLVSHLIRSDRRLNPASGVRSVDFTLKYTGRVIWVRPWGGSANGKWIPFEKTAYVSLQLAPVRP